MSEGKGGHTIMLTLAHRVAGLRARNRRGNSTRSVVPAWSIPFERHVIPPGSKSAEPSVAETAQWPYTHTTWPQSGNDLAKNACETRALHQEPSVASCRSKQSQPWECESAADLISFSEFFPSPPTPCLVRVYSHRLDVGITRQECNITGASKIACTCVCSRPRSQMNVFLATHPALNQSCSIAHLGHAGTLVCTIPGWACTIRNKRGDYLFSFF